MLFSDASLQMFLIVGWTFSMISSLVLVTGVILLMLYNTLDRFMP